MSAGGGNSGDDVFDGPMEHSSDDFSGGSEDEDGMFDIFTGELKNAPGEAEFSEAFEERVQPTAEALPYVYGSLKGTNNIRVLDLEPNEDFAAPLRANMRLTSLDDPCKFLAVSYVWGQLHTDGSHLCETLYISGQPLKVTRSLHSALRHVLQHWMSGQLSLESAPLTIWIDGACIDQSNQAERGQQVSLMARIFAFCHALVAFLGNDAQHSGEGKLFSSTNFLRETASALHGTGTPPTRPVSYLENEAHVLAYINQIRAFLCRPWFTRLWVAQEFINGYGKNTRVIVGDFALIGGAVRALVKNIMLARASLVYDGQLTEGPASLAECPQPPLFFTQGREYNSLLNFMQQFDDMSCSDDRDRVYALLGAFKRGTSLIAPDYSKTVEEVYCDFASEQVGLVGSVDVIQWLAFALSRQSSAHHDVHGLPSWVPDWRIRSQFQSRSHEHAAKCERSSLRGEVLNLAPGIRYASWVKDLHTTHTHLIQPLSQCIVGGPDTAYMDTIEHAPQRVLAIRGVLMRPSLFAAGAGPLDPSPVTKVLETYTRLSPRPLCLGPRPLCLGPFDEATPLPLSQSMGYPRSKNLELKDIVQKLASDQQYLCFFGSNHDTYIVRAFKRYPATAITGDGPQKAYKLLAFVALPIQDVGAFNAVLRHIPLETIHLI